MVYSAENLPRLKLAAEDKNSKNIYIFGVVGELSNCREVVP